MQGTTRGVLRALEEADVRYLIVGGVAVVLHGILRTTLDLDLVIQLEHENVSRAINAFERLGFEPRAPVPMASFVDADQREAWAREKNMKVFSLWHPDEVGFAVDLFLREPFDFDATFSRSNRVKLADIEASVIGREDLVTMKKRAGRDRDLEDVRMLLKVATTTHEPES